MSKFCSLGRAKAHKTHIYMIQMKWCRFEKKIRKTQICALDSAIGVRRTRAPNTNGRVKLGILRPVSAPLAAEQGAEMRPEKLSFWSLSAPCFAAP